MSHVHNSGPTQVGTVYLIGAGPGDPELLTLKGARLLAECDVVLYDNLANPALLDLARPEAERIFVGKQANRHTMPQEEINALLVRLGRQGKRVARLKGGDPYVFGRGGEEAEALVEAGVPFEVVPGITAAIAAPAYAGIPVTHRDATATFVLVTGHEDPTKEESNVDFAALARIGTIAFYMGVKNLAKNAARLVEAGMDPDTPAALIRMGTHPQQETVTGTLATIARVAEEAGIKPPAMTLIGQVVRLRDRLRWFDNRPLFGQTIVVTRTRQQASELSRRLSDLGAAVLEAPTIAIERPDDLGELDEALRRVRDYDWLVLTSVNGVLAMAERMKALELDGRDLGGVRLAAIGPATAAALQAHFLQADCLPDEFVAEALAAKLKEQLGELRGRKFLLLRADIARPSLRVALEQAGAVVREVAVYRTVRPASLPEAVLAALDADEVDWLTFTSASTAHNFVELAGPERVTRIRDGGRVRLASIGPITTEALASHGLKPTVQAGEYTIPGLVAAIRDHERTGQAATGSR